MATIDDFPRRGVSAALVATIMASAESLADIGLGPASTTGDVFEKLVKPATSEKQCALVDLYEGKEFVDANGVPLVGEANVFVSHAWSNPFSAAALVMCEYDAARRAEHAAQGNQQPFKELYFWFDLFVNNQYEAPARPVEWWSSTFKNAIEALDHVLVVMSPFNSPVVLTRAWCLWEVFCGMDHQDLSKLVMRAPSTELPALQAALIENSDGIEDTVVAINPEEAEATRLSDKTMIFQVVKETLPGGFAALSARVKMGLRHWLVSATEDVIQYLESSGQDHSAEYADLCRAAGQAVLNQHDTALDYFNRALNKFAELEDYAMVAICNHDIGSKLVNLGKFDEAEVSLETALKLYRTEYGKDSNAVADAYNALGHLFSCKGDYKQAIDYFQKCRKIFEREEGSSSVAEFNLGYAYQKFGDNANALKYFELALAGTRKDFGEEHAVTMTCYYFLGNYYNEIGDLERAKEHCDRALAFRVLNSGEEDDDTAASYSSLALIQTNMGLYDKAVANFHKALDWLVPSLGEEDRYTKEARAGLAEALRLQADTAGTKESSVPVDAAKDCGATPDTKPEASTTTQSSASSNASETSPKKSCCSVS